MSTDDVATGSREVVAKFLSLLERGDADPNDLGALIADDVQWRHQPGATGRAELIHGRDDMLRHLFSEDGLDLYEQNSFRQSVGPLIAEGEFVATVATVRARTRRGDEYENRYALFFRVVDDVIVELDEMFDTLYFNQMHYG